MSQEITRHAVVMHSGGSGYVVRTAYLQTDGSWWIPNPYSQATPVKLYKRECDAEKLADKLNAEIRNRPIKVDDYATW